MAMTVTVPALAKVSRSMMSLPSGMAPAPVISRWKETGLRCIIVLAGMGISGTVCMVRMPPCRAPGARSCTLPPTLVRTEMSLSAWPLLRIFRYATVVPGVVGAGTYALATAIDDVAPADAHPVTTSTASKAAAAIRKTDVSLRTVTGYSASRGDDPPRPPRSWGDPSPQTPLGGTHPPRPPLGGPIPRAPLGGTHPPRPPLDGGAEQAQRRGSEVQHRLVETLQREADAPVLPGTFPELEDLQLAPGIPAVGRVEGGSPGLGQRRGPGQVGIRLEPAGRVVDRHPGRVHPDGARQPGHPHQCLQPDADRDPRVAAAEPLFHAELLAVVRPALDECAGVQGPPDFGRHVP